MNHEDERIKEVLQGKHQSFEPLMRPYRNSMLSLTYRMTGNIEEAKEVCQEVLLKAFRHLHRFRRGKSFKNWLYAIALRTTYDFLKKKRRDTDLYNRQKRETLFSVDDPETRLARKELQDKIQDCLNYLTPKERAVFILRDVEGESIKDAMKVMGVSSNSVRTHLCRARRKIRDQFQKLNQTEGSKSYEMP